MTSRLPGRILVECAFWLTLAAFFFGFSFTFESSASAEVISAEVWPRFFAVLVAVVAILHAVSQVSSGEVEGTDDLTPAQQLRAVGRFAALIAAPLAFVFLVTRIGFYVAMPLFLLAQLLVLGERRPAVIALTVLIASALVILVFTVFFYIALPVGSWPIFYDINSAIISALR